MSQPHSQKKILIVEDDPDIRGLLTRILTGDGYLVAESPDGEHALEIALNEQPDLILMDIRLPGIDGYTTTHNLKQVPQFRDVPVIFLSGQSPAEDSGRSFAAGGSIYLRKPIHKNQLRHVLGLVFDSPGEPQPTRKENEPERR